MSERRHAHRRPLGDFVTAVYGAETRLFLACDISERGLFLRSTGANERDLAEHDGTVLVQFQLPSDETTHWACGRLSRRGHGCDGPGAGLHFTFVPPTTQSGLREFLAAA